jgi:hypothetical protein
MKKTALLVGLAVFPLLVYPSLVFISVLPDIVVGDRSMIFLLTYEPKPTFLQRILADWRAALPASYAVVFLLVLPLHLLLDRFALTGVIPRIASIALVSGMLSFFILRLDGWSTAAMVVCGVLVSSLFHAGVLAWRKLQGVA